MSKVLIIEDDFFYRKIYIKKFEHAGWQVESAENGSQGLEKMRSFMPDIVFTDLVMPQIEGFHMIGMAKADPALQHIPIVVLTNLSSIDKEQALSKGADALMVKSETEPDIIIDKANEILNKNNADKQDTTTTQ